ncbi:hypothetical protein QBC40DRAFT_248857 [Triangularia verruculosa]|uniref:Biogenesis of lysosome-related organelles complex 1 subunit KXD1 n=1 Tax=Triangularia verruculosa TaxID=2587418 RepID=A0AAN7AZU7_9PEZI|nr:hypothetical protein QBC40DRAFT_248857 [Triangularia verruculosa]
MSHYSTPYYPTSSVPIPPAKPTPYPSYPSYYPPVPGGADSTYSVSPPELADDGHSLVSTGGGSYSVGPSASTGSSDYYYGNGVGDVVGNVAGNVVAAAGNVDLNEYMQERFAASFDPVGLDKCTVKQAQTSGHLNAKHRELLELQAKAQARLAKTRARFAQGMEDAREVREDLEWTQRKVASLKTKASKKHAHEYTKARARYPSPDY